MGKNIKIKDGPVRKRGRPAGNNRVPLSEAERKARNAQYERERRAENAEAMAELAEAMGIDLNKVPTSELLDRVISYLSQERQSTECIKNINKKVKMQIRTLEQRINLNPVEEEGMSPPLPVVLPELNFETPGLPVYDSEPLPEPSSVDALTSGYGYSPMSSPRGNIMFEALPITAQNSPSDGLVFDYDSLFEYLEKHT